MTAAICEWCGTPFEPRHGGKAQKFCSAGCRIALHRVARLWALGELEAGRLSVAALREWGASNVYVSPDSDAASDATQLAKNRDTRRQRGKGGDRP